MGLTAMAEASGISYDVLAWTSEWYLREPTLRSANAAIVDYHHGLPMSQRFGSGTLSSSDGQRFPMRGRRSLTARHLSRYFVDEGISTYTHVSDQHSTYGTKIIVATDREAHYVLDEILGNATDLPITEHAVDTGGVTLINFALFDLVGLVFSPRIRNLGRIVPYRLGPRRDYLARYPHAGPLLTGITDEDLIDGEWDNMLRLAASFKYGHSTASLLVGKLSASSRQSRRPESRRIPRRLPDEPPRHTAATLAWSSLVVPVNLCRQLQGAVLQHLGVGHADTHFRRGVLDRAPLQESQLQDPAVVVGQRFQDDAHPLGGHADCFLTVWGRGDVLDRGDLAAQRGAPVRGQHGACGGPQIRTHLGHTCRNPQRPESGQEHLGCEIFRIGLVADPGEYRPIHPGCVVPIDCLPIGIPPTGHHPQRGPGLGIALRHHTPVRVEHSGRRKHCHPLPMVPPVTRSHWTTVQLRGTDRRRIPTSIVRPDGGCGFRNPRAT
jgi:TnpA family transposase